MGLADSMLSCIYACVADTLWAFVGKGSLDVVDLNVHQEGEHSIDDEISQKTERLGLNTDEPPASVVNASAPTAAAASGAADAGEKKTRPCSICGGDFADVALYREHFRSEWHRYNLKRKAQKLPVIDEVAFNSLDRDAVKSFFATLNE